MSNGISQKQISKTAHANRIYSLVHCKSIQLNTLTPIHSSKLEGNFQQVKKKIPSHTEGKRKLSSHIVSDRKTYKTGFFKIKTLRLIIIYNLTN